MKLRTSSGSRARFIGPLLLAAAALAGCSALQIDVDVYKGPLLSQPEIQQRQYAYLAISAKPLIQQLLEDTKVAFEGCADKADCKTSNQKIQSFLEEILDHYTGKAAGLKSVQSGAKTENRGIEWLTQKLADAYAKPDGLTNRKTVDTALAALNEVLINFASRILFVVNHETLYRDARSHGLAGLADHKPVLQSLANTLLLHANDLHRQAAREDQQFERAQAENDAVARAFRVAPSTAFDQIQSRLVPPKPKLMPAAKGDAPQAGGDKNAQLAPLETQLKADSSALELLQSKFAGLLASFRTLVDEPGRQAGVSSLPAAELKGADMDRKAVLALYPATPASAADRTETGALGPLRAWLDRERSATSAAVSPDRKLRLALTFQYLEADKARLLSGAADAVNKADVLSGLKRRLDQDQTLAQQQVSDSRAAIDKLTASLQRLRSEAANEARLATQARDAEKKAGDEQEAGRAIASVLDHVRSTVLQQADAAQVNDEAGLHALLKKHLTELKPGADGIPSQAAIATTRAEVDKIEATVALVCSKAPGGDDRCKGQQQIDTVDRLIAGLRAQRVKALAEGRAQAADNLLDAINVAYEQRAAMVYLRPASDYLRSVHSASDLQEAGERQYRNMLNDWFRYLDPSRRQGDTAEARRVELEKLYWQNVNRVTVGGGGFTNFVLAKDDIGNWYVKAYSSDPEVILKSATQLAMFNAGSRLNVNLVQRYQLQQQIDSSNSSDEKSELRTQLAQMNYQDGTPLLALRGRYLKRYEANTRETAQSLHKQLTEMPAQLDALVDANAAGKGESCSLPELKKAVSALDSSHLAAQRDKLDSLLAQLGVADDKLLDKIEQATFNGLTALVRYMGAAYKAVDGYSSTACDAAWRQALAKKARELPRAQVLALASERRTAVERYEDALMNITDVATQK